MNNIEKFKHIRPGSLNEGNYLESLIVQAADCGMLNENEIINIQNGLLDIISHKIKRLNDGENYSVPADTAHKLSRSVFFTISLRLKKYPNPDTAASELKKGDLTALYREGSGILEKLVRDTLLLYEEVKTGMLPIDNCFYRTTIEEGIPAFFKNYNTEFFAHKKHITGDYPTLAPVGELFGIEFINKYLTNIKHENDFCSLFEAGEIESLLRGYSRDYKEQVFNISEYVLYCALGCVIAGKASRRLWLCKSDIRTIGEAISANRGKTGFLKECFLKFISDTGFEDKNDYMMSALEARTGYIYNAAGSAGLDKIFIIPAGLSENIMTFDYGTRMENSKYRMLIEELSMCGDIPGRTGIIKEYVTSLEDICDLFGDFDFTADEYKAVFGLLQPAELAAVYNRYNMGQGAGEVDWAAEFLIYINGLDTKTKNIIKKFIDSMEG